MLRELWIQIASFLPVKYLLPLLSTHSTIYEAITSSHDNYLANRMLYFPWNRFCGQIMSDIIEILNPEDKIYQEDGSITPLQYSFKKSSLFLGIRNSELLPILPTAKPLQMNYSQTILSSAFLRYLRLICLIFEIKPSEEYENRLLNLLKQVKFEYNYFKGFQGFSFGKTNFFPRCQFLAKQMKKFVELYSRYDRNSIADHILEFEELAKHIKEFSGGLCCRSINLDKLEPFFVKEYPNLCELGIHFFENFKALPNVEKLVVYYQAAWNWNEQQAYSRAFFKFPHFSFKRGTISHISLQKQMVKNPNLYLQYAIPSNLLYKIAVKSAPLLFRDVKSMTFEMCVDTVQVYGNSIREILQLSCVQTEEQRRILLVIACQNSFLGLHEYVKEFKTIPKHINIDKLLYYDVTPCVIPEFFRKDRNIVLMLLKRNPSLYHQMDHELKQDVQFLKDCVLKQPHLYSYIPEILQNDVQVMQHMLKYKPVLCPTILSKINSLHVAQQVIPFWIDFCPSVMISSWPLVVQQDPQLMNQMIRVTKCYPNYPPDNKEYQIQLIMNWIFYNTLQTLSFTFLKNFPKEYHLVCYISDPTVYRAMIPSVEALEWFRNEVKTTLENKIQNLFY